PVHWLRDRWIVLAVRYGARTPPASRFRELANQLRRTRALLRSGRVGVRDLGFAGPAGRAESPSPNSTSSFARKRNHLRPSTLSRTTPLSPAPRIAPPGR